MNILFIEDDQELKKVAEMQIRAEEHEVFGAVDLEEAQAIMDNPDLEIHAVIADHRLPDGFGVDFVIDNQEKYPHLSYVVVSACVSSENLERLKAKKIRFFPKPLLYRKVLDFLKADRMKRVLERADSRKEIEALTGKRPPPELSKKSATTTSAEAVAPSAPPPKKKSLFFRLFGRK